MKSDREEGAIEMAEREILDARARRLAQLRASEDFQSVLPVGEFLVGGDAYALPLEGLRAVLPLRGGSFIPLVSSHVLGVLRFQGRLVCAMSLLAPLGAKGWRRECSVLLVVERDDARWAAIDFEQVPRIAELPLADIEQARARSKGPVLDVTLRGRRQVGLIDLSALISATVAGKNHG